MNPSYDPNDPIYEPVPYEHTRFPLGTQVYIDPAIRAIHPEHYAAGLTGTVVASVYYPVLEHFEFLEHFESRPYTTYVPVQLSSGFVSLVEEEYVYVQVSE